MTTSLPHRILQSLRARQAGAVATAAYFVSRGFGSRAAVDQALSRLARSGALQRVDRGLYQRPRLHPRLGALPARAADVVDAVRRCAPGAGIKVQSDGATAANRLGLSTQVPMQPTWLTTGRGRVVHIGRQTLRFVHDVRLPAAVLGTPAGEVLAALRWLGPDGVDAVALDRVGTRLAVADRARLGRVARTQPAWLRPVLDGLAGAS